jgi:hypothetical protein
VSKELVVTGSALDELAKALFAPADSADGRAPQIGESVVIEVCSQEISSDWNVPLLQFNTWITKAIQEIPEEFRETAKFTIDCDCDFGNDMTISYERPQTAEEFRAKQEEREQRQRAMRRQDELRERAEYERLKAKYG